MRRYRAVTAEETRGIGREFARRLEPGAIVCMNGPLGAGKTTFIQGAASCFDIEEAVTSPSFTIASEYEGTLPFYHIDVYRLDSAEEFELLGLEEYLFGAGVTFIEWSEKIREALPSPLWHVEITIERDGSRTIDIGFGEQ